MPERREMPTILGVIPARSGSVRLPKKNIRYLAGKPLISWTISAALNSRYVTEVIVSTDCAETAKLAKLEGASVPFLRPAELSGPEATSVAVVEHAISQMRSMGKVYDYIALLQPTSPLRNFQHLDAAIGVLTSSNYPNLVSVCEIDHPVEWALEVDQNLVVSEQSLRGFSSNRSQDLPTRYRPNGAIYLVESEKFADKRKLIFDSEVLAYTMDKTASVDIDDIFDFELAEFHLKKSMMKAP
jgi:CMP-N-acetylneuraminic acid synthetase